MGEGMFLDSGECGICVRASNEKGDPKLSFAHARGTGVWPGVWHV